MHRVSWFRFQAIKPMDGDAAFVQTVRHGRTCRRVDPPL